MTGREQFQIDLAEAQAGRDRLVEEIAAALDGKGWRRFEDTWSKTDHTPAPERAAHTVRGLHLARRSQAHPFGRPYYVIWALKADGHGQATDQAHFTDVAETIAWIEQPRSDTTIAQRVGEEDARRLEQRDQVELAGLAGRKTDFGRSGKNQTPFQVIEFEGLGRVRITTLGPRQWRIAIKGRTRVVTAAEGQDARQAVRAAIEALHAEVADAR